MVIAEIGIGSPMVKKLLLFLSIPCGKSLGKRSTPPFLQRIVTGARQGGLNLRHENEAKARRDLQDSLLAL